MQTSGDAMKTVISKRLAVNDLAALKRWHSFTEATQRGVAPVASEARANVDFGELKRDTRPHRQWRLSKAFIEAAQARSIKVVAVAMVGETDPIIDDLLPDVCCARVGQLGKMIAHFKRTHVREAAMAGGARRPFIRARPDLQPCASCRTLLRRDDQCSGTGCGI